MPTMTRLDKDRITFKTIADERGAALPGLMASFFFVVGVFGMSQGPITHFSRLLFIPFVLFASFIALVALPSALSSDRLDIDLRRRTYDGRRGPLFWRERLSGPLDDIEGMRLIYARTKHNTEGPEWALEFKWRKGVPAPFHIHYWRRPRSFRLDPRPGELDPPALARTLRAISRDTGLPLQLPEAFLDSLGVLDLDVDLPVGGASPSSKR